MKQEWAFVLWMGAQTSQNLKKYLLSQGAERKDIMDAWVKVIDPSLLPDKKAGNKSG